LNNPLNKTKLSRQFSLAYKLAFLTKSKKKEWHNIFCLWLSAAKGGHKRAQFYLGTCYDNGLGIHKDTKEAYKWYLKAAKQGHMESQYNIGFFYSEGKLMRQNTLMAKV